MSRKANDAKTTRKARKAAIKKATTSKSKTVVTQIIPNFTFIADNLPPLLEISDKSLLAASLDRSCPEHQRLAFLGDRVFEVGAMKSVWNSCSSARVLNDARQRLTTNLAFSQIAEAYGFRTRLNLGELVQSDGQVKTLGTALEARLGASYLDAWNEKAERDVIRWAAEVLSIERWKGMREFLQLAEANDGKKRIYPIHAKGEIWADGMTHRTLNDNTLLTLKRAETKPSVEQSIHRKLGRSKLSPAKQSTSIISRICNYLLSPVASTPDPPTVSAVTFARLLRARRLNQEKQIKSAALSPTSNSAIQENNSVPQADIPVDESAYQVHLEPSVDLQAKDGSKAEDGTTPRIRVSTQDEWKPPMIPLNVSALPRLLPLKDKTRSFLQNLSAKELHAYQQEGLMRLRKPLQRVLSSHNKHRSASDKLFNALRCNQTISHLARFYGLSIDPDGSECDQKEAARRFARYFAMLVKDRKYLDDDKALGPWLHKVFSQKAWPTIDNSAEIITTSNIAKKSQKPPTSETVASSKSNHHVKPPHFLSASRNDAMSDATNITKALQDLQDRLDRVEWAIDHMTSINLPRSSLPAEPPADISEAKLPTFEAGSLSLAKRKTKSRSDEPRAKETWASIQAPETWLSPSIPVNLSQLPGLSSSLRAIGHGAEDASSLPTNQYVELGMQWLKERMLGIIIPHCRYQETINYILGFHLELSVTSRLAMFYRLVPPGEGASEPDGGNQAAYGDVYVAFIGRLTQKSDCAEASSWLSGITSPDVWIAIHSLAERHKPNKTFAMDSSKSSQLGNNDSVIAQKTNPLLVSARESVQDRQSTTPKHKALKAMDDVWIPPKQSFNPTKLPPPLPGIAISMEGFYSSMQSDSIKLNLEDHRQLQILLTEHVKSMGVTGNSVTMLVKSMSSSRSISHLATWYGLDLDLDGNQLDQQSAARVFRRYIAILLEKAKKANGEEARHRHIYDWLAQVFGVEVWQDLKTFCTSIPLRSYVATSGTGDAQIGLTPELAIKDTETTLVPQDLHDPSDTSMSLTVFPLPANRVVEDAAGGCAEMGSVQDKEEELPLANSLNPAKHHDLTDIQSSSEKIITSETNVITVGKTAHNNLRQRIESKDG